MRTGCPVPPLADTDTLRQKLPMLPDLCVRLAAGEDADALKNLIADVGPESTAAPVCWQNTLVATQNDVFIGFASWAQDEMLALIVGLGVRVSHRRFGVASELLETMAERLRTDGARLLECTVRHGLSDVGAMLERHRFRAVGAWVQTPDGLPRWVTPFDPAVKEEEHQAWVRYERRLLGRRRNRGDGFYA